MPEQNEERLKYLFNVSAIEVPKAEEGKKRKFNGTAYAGGRVDGHWYPYRLCCRYSGDIHSH